MELHSQSGRIYSREKSYRNVSLNNLNTLRAEAISHVLGKEIKPDEVNGIINRNLHQGGNCLIYKTSETVTNAHLESFQKDERKGTIMYLLNGKEAYLELR